MALNFVQIGKHIGEIRKRRGLSQQKLSEIIDKSPTYVSYISYRCDVKRVTTINYDRKVIRAELAKLNRQTDETSAKIDLCLVTSRVEYEPPFDVNASFAEAFEAYTENAKA